VSAPSSLGLLGGSFDPVHNGHLVLARDLRERLGLDRMILIPAAQSPFKSAHEYIAPAKQRLAMARLAVRGEDGVEVSDLELRRPSPSYTVDTVRALQAAFPGTRLVWMVGADNLAGLPRWREAEVLTGLCEIWVVARGGIDAVAARRALAALPPFFRRALRGRMLETRRMEISSTEIRDRARRGLSNKGLVPDAVNAYIARHSLYV
jgi:nicotinate-nucleotide adenylyltransferase